MMSDNIISVLSGTETTKSDTYLRLSLKGEWKNIYTEYLDTITLK